ncbi:Peptidase C1-like family [seawater metagenome]|uniref:Peptidase C1-like family n=1 Tax=seawater metagenome TaxID=1561972 RepID=A0A5E8CKC2_9ZZZZ
MKLLRVKICGDYNKICDFFKKYNNENKSNFTIKDKEFIEFEKKNDELIIFMSNLKNFISDKTINVNSNEKLYRNYNDASNNISNTICDNNILILCEKKIPDIKNLKIIISENEYLINPQFLSEEKNLMYFPTLFFTEKKIKFNIGDTIKISDDKTWKTIGHVIPLSLLHSFSDQEYINMNTINQYHQQYNILYSNLIFTSLENHSKDKDFLKKLKDRKIKKKIPHIVNVSNQQRSSRCWIFAFLNFTRLKIMNKITNLENFELSQSYVIFYDILEKCNFFLENISKSRNLNIHSQKFQKIIKKPIREGNSAINAMMLVNKYGLVPKCYYPDFFHSVYSSEMYNFLNLVLKKYAIIIRNSKLNGGWQNEKQQMMTNIYHILIKFLGVPPKYFYFNNSLITPLQLSKIANIDSNNYISVVNNPIITKKIITNRINNLISVKKFNTKLNLPKERIKELIKKMIDINEAVIFDNDVKKYLNNEDKTLAFDQFKYNDLFNIDLNFSKSEMIQYKLLKPDHSMIIIGYGDGFFEVENSWGNLNNSKKSSYRMTEEWFDKFSYTIYVKKSILNDNEKMLIDFGLFYSQ